MSATRTEFAMTTLYIKGIYGRHQACTAQLDNAVDLHDQRMGTTQW